MVIKGIEDKSEVRKDSNDGRTYVWGGESFDSVTSILSRAIPKPALINWAKKVTAEYAVENYEQLGSLIDTDVQGAIDWLKGAAWRQRDKAANLGTYVHDVIEAQILGLAEPEPPYDEHDPLKMVMQFHDFVDTVKPKWIAAEAVVFNRAHGYAGTLDAICTIDDDTYLVDVKTGKGVYAETALQLVAYRNAEFMGLPDGEELPMPPVNECAVLHIRPEGWKLIPMTAGDREWAFFTRACTMAKFGDESRDMVGKPIYKGAAK